MGLTLKDLGKYTTSRAVPFELSALKDFYNLNNLPNSQKRDKKFKLWSKDGLSSVASGINAATGLWGAYNASRARELAREAFNETKAGGRANFSNAARALNMDVDKRNRLAMSTKAYNDAISSGTGFKYKRLSETY